MARTAIRRPAAPTQSVSATPAETKTTYKGHLIEVEQAPEGYFVTYAIINNMRRRCRNMEHAKQLIDAVPVKEPEGPFGGWMKNPPEFCKHKRIDKEGLWAETVICGYHCEENHHCAVYALLMNGSKTRIKLLDSHNLSKQCPYCEAATFSEGVTITAYSCGTTGDRLTQQYTRICKPPQTGRRRR